MPVLLPTRTRALWKGRLHGAEVRENGPGYVWSGEEGSGEEWSGEEWSGPGESELTELWERYIVNIAIQIIHKN